jgi:hypothetical protein
MSGDPVTATPKLFLRATPPQPTAAVLSMARTSNNQYQPRLHMRKFVSFKSSKGPATSFTTYRKHYSGKSDMFSELNIRKSHAPSSEYYTDSHNQNTLGQTGMDHYQIKNIQWYGPKKDQSSTNGQRQAEKILNTFGLKKSLNDQTYDQQQQNTATVSPVGIHGNKNSYDQQQQSTVNNDQYGYQQQHKTPTVTHDVLQHPPQDNYVQQSVYEPVNIFQQKQPSIQRSLPNNGGKQVNSQSNHAPVIYSHRQAMKQFPNPTATNEYQTILPTGDTLGNLKQNENVKQTQHLPGNYYHSNALLNQNGAYESMQNANNYGNGNEQFNSNYQNRNRNDGSLPSDVLPLTPNNNEHYQSFNDYNNAYTPPQTNQKNSVISQYPLNPKRKEQGKHVSPNFRNKVLYPHQLKSQTFNHGPQMPGAIVKDIVETYEVRRILEPDMQGKQLPELMPNVDIGLGSPLGYSSNNGGQNAVTHTEVHHQNNQQQYSSNNGGQSTMTNTDGYHQNNPQQYSSNNGGQNTITNTDSYHQNNQQQYSANNGGQNTVTNTEVHHQNNQQPFSDPDQD